MCYMYPQYYWFMGATLLVEISTWFIIARRVMHKSGISKRSIVLYWLISSFYYATWFLGRLILFPYLLFVCYKTWMGLVLENSSIYNVASIALITQSFLVMMCWKWTIDMLKNILESHYGNCKRKISEGL